MAIKLDSVATNSKIGFWEELNAIEVVVIHVLIVVAGDTNQMVMWLKIGVIAGMRLVDWCDESRSFKNALSV